jgi:hypothetical protein
MKKLTFQNIHWTNHSRMKMKFYGLSEARVKRVLRAPKRVEEGIAENTIALMQPASVKTRAGKPFLAKGKKFFPRQSASSPRQSTAEEIWTQEIWVMIQIKHRLTQTFAQTNVDNFQRKSVISPRQSAITVISTWRYPGKSPVRNPIPKEIISELKQEGYI